MGFSAVKGMDLGMFLVRRCKDREVGLKEPVPKYAEFGKHRAAEDNWIQERRPVYVLDDIGQAGFYEHLAHGLNEARPGVPVSVSLCEITIGLAWGRCVNSVESSYKVRI
jgi:hypothetical protein